MAEDDVGGWGGGGAAHVLYVHCMYIQYSSLLRQVAVCGSQASAFLVLCLVGFGTVAELVELCRLTGVKSRVKLAFARGVDWHCQPQYWLCCPARSDGGTEVV